MATEMSKSKNHVNYQFPSDSLDGLLRNRLWKSGLRKSGLRTSGLWKSTFTHRSDTCPLLPTGLTLRISVSQWVKVDCHAVAVTGLTLETRATVVVVVTGSTGGVWTGGRGRVSASG